ncbi:MAG: BON domain-containing protein [Myxococcales bacterium]
MAEQSDEQIREAVHERLVQLPFQGETPTLEVRVADGIVTLRGEVPGQTERQQITEMIRGLNVAKSVRDELKVKG